ncbi:MAG: deoxyribose-phosphate aldolase, partial [Desulfuromonadales bacterium]|nr:deoxyribose-phosphate aldolase [Desulfuromonadales bacterium]
MNSPAKHIDHTLLKSDASGADIANLCEEAVEHGFASVCVPPSYVPQASQLLYGSGVAVCTVVGFPLGYQTTETKAFEARQAVSAGASEVDMVINLGSVRNADFTLVGDDIRRVVAAAENAVVKVIIECCLLDNAEKSKLVDIIVKSGAGYVKTSTGFAAFGATLEDVKLLAECSAGRIQVKAAGGVRDFASCRD